MARIPIPGVAQEAGQLGMAIAPETTPQRSLTGVNLQQVGQGLQAAGFEASRVADFLQDQHDDAKGIENDNRAADVVRKWLYDPELGYLHKKGAAAGKEAREEAFRNIEAGLAEIEKGIENPVQMEHWRRQTSNRLEQATLHADQHQAKSVFEHKWGALAARAKNAMVAGDLGLLKGAVAEMSAVAGDDEAMARQRLLEHTTEFHEQEINNIQDPQKAAQELVKRVAEIDPNRLDDLRRSVETRAHQKAGQIMALDILATVEKGTGSDIEKQRKAQQLLLQIERTGKHDPAVTDDARDRINELYGIERGLTEQEYQQKQRKEQEEDRKYQLEQRAYQKGQQTRTLAEQEREDRTRGTGSRLAAQLEAALAASGAGDTEQAIEAGKLVALAELSGQFDPEVIHEARRHVEHHYNQRRQLQDQAQKEALERVENSLRENESLTVDTLPGELTQTLKQLGVFGFARRAEEVIRAQRLAADTPEDLERKELHSDVQTIDTMNYLARELADYKEPAPDASAPDAHMQLAIWKNRQDRRRQLAKVYAEMAHALMNKPRDAEKLGAVSQRQRARRTDAERAQMLHDALQKMGPVQAPGAGK